VTIQHPQYRNGACGRGYETVDGRDAIIEPTGRYLRRVSEAHPGPRSWHSYKKSWAPNKAFVSY